jgi:hypothetical protein
MWYEWRGGLALLALLGLIGAPAALWIALAAVLVQLLCYLLYAHSWSWSLYYIEGQPVFAAVTALGIVRLARVAGRAMVAERRVALAGTLSLAALAYPALVTARQVRAQIANDHAFYDSFASLLPHSPDGAIVFVRYAPTHNDGLSLVRNRANLNDARVWTVYDRGAENARLMALAPKRAAYLFDEATWSLQPLARPEELVRNSR